MSNGTALITGASSGIGATYADRLARRGHDLILVARDGARLDTLAARLRGETGRRIDVLVADLADDAQLASVERRLVENQEISLLVNNAGIDINDSTTTASRETLHRLLAVNITAVALLAAAAARAFAARKHGGIINISSVLSLIPEFRDGHGAVYSGTKSFVLNLSQGLAAEVGGLGVRVQAVLPGLTRTEIHSRAQVDVSGVPAEWFMQVGDLVDAALVGFDRGEIITIPPLANETDWTAMQAARHALMPQLSRSEAPRYLTPSAA